MIDLIIFYVHFFVAVYAFTKNWQDAGLKQGLLSVALILLIFSIGWAMTGTLAFAVWPKSWNTVYFTNDTLALVLLLIPEIFFFYHFFFKNNEIKNETVSD